MVYRNLESYLPTAIGLDRITLDELAARLKQHTGIAFRPRTLLEYFRGKYSSSAVPLRGYEDGTYSLNMAYYVHPEVLPLLKLDQ